MMTMVNAISLAAVLCLSSSAVSAKINDLETDTPSALDSSKTTTMINELPAGLSSRTKPLFPSPIAVVQEAAVYGITMHFRWSGLCGVGVRFGVYFCPLLQNYTLQFEKYE